MSCTRCLRSIIKKEVVMNGQKCKNCGGGQFFTRYLRGQKVALVCSNVDCKEEIPIKKSKKEDSNV